MGSEASPEISDIAMHEIENKILKLDTNIHTWLRYHDDVTLLYDGNASQLLTLVVNINEIHLSIKFTCDYSDNMLDFLDLTIFKGKRFGKERILDNKSH